MGVDSRCVVHATFDDLTRPRFGGSRSADLDPRAGFLRNLCYFADTAVQADVQLLAAACRLVLTAQVPQEVAGTAGSRPPRLQLCMHAASRETGAAVVFQSRQLTALCLSALSRHAAQLATQLQLPRLGQAAAAAAPSWVPPLLEVVLLLSSPESWLPALGAAAAKASTWILEATIQRGLFGQLIDIASAACPEGHGHPCMAAEARPGVPCGEALVTALTVRVLALQQNNSHQQVEANQRSADKVELQLPLLLTLPLLDRRLPTMRPVTARLWRQAVAALHGRSVPDLASWLRVGRGPVGTPGVAAGAAAAVLGNLLEGATHALEAENAQQPETAGRLALQFSALASMLVALLPQPFFPGHPSSGVFGKWAEDDDEGAAQLATISPVKLPWDSEQLPSSALLSQLQLVSDGALLRSLVRATLPLTTAHKGGGALAHLQQRARDVHQLCGLLAQLMALPGQQQRVLVTLAFSADLTQRLWFSYLRPAQAAPGQCGELHTWNCLWLGAKLLHVVWFAAAGGTGWVPSTDGTCDPGWMLPLTLFSLAYSAFIITGACAASDTASSSDAGYVCSAGCAGAGSVPSMH